MKLLLLWLVATWVVAVTADRPCSEYCVYLSSGLRDIEFQTGCDCTYEDPELGDDIGARILYEPARISPDYTHNQPFYILNPITSRRRTYPTDSGPVIPEAVQTSLNMYYPDVELNENTYSTQNRQEKDIRPNSNKLNTRVYLDVDVDLEDVKRSASSNTLTAQELHVTEQNLLECANFYTKLHYRKNTNTKDDIPESKPSNDYSYTSNEELKKEIQNKCSHISFIVEESLNEIKKTRSKITSVTYRIDNNDQQNTSNNENNSESSIQNERSESTIREYTENPEQTTIPFTFSSENTSTTSTYTLSSEVFSTVEDLTRGADVQSPDTQTTVKKNNERHVSAPRYAENEYPIHEESSTIMASTTEHTFVAALTSKDTKDLNIVEDNQIKKDLKTEEVERQYENRVKYEEGEVPLIKIITHEFGNDTVLSYINGNEDIPNSDFNYESKSADVDKQTEDSTEIPTSNQFIRSALRDDTRTPNTKNQTSTDTDLSGNLYFLFDDEQIPARFVQNANGSLHLGIDGTALCNTLTENTEHQSVLLTNLCNCYASDDCRHKKTN